MRRRALIFALLYTVVILYLCFYPGAFSPLPKAVQLEWVPWTGRRQILDAVLNVLLYVPLGYAAGLAAGGTRWGLVIVTLLGSGLSLGVEYLQLWTPLRFSNYNDWLMNSTGALAGAALARLNLWAYDSTWGRWWRAWHLRPEGILFGSLWLLWFAFPFVPRIALGVTVAQFTSLGPWSWENFVTTALSMAGLSMILGSSPWLAVAVAAVAAQPLLLDRALSGAQVAGAVLGWTAIARFPSVARFLGWILLGWLIVEQFRPWTFTAKPEAFSWVPFESWYDGDSSRYYPIIFGKLFLYTVTLRTLRATGLSWKWAVGLPAAVLFTGEWAQRYLPGRTPELTDVVLLLAGFTLTLLIRDEQAPQAKH